MDTCRCCGAEMSAVQEVCAQCGVSVDEAMGLVYRGAEFQAHLRLLNALYHPTDSWQVTTARKDHTDLFGQPIPNGAVYFRKHTGPGWGDVIRLSRLSMDHLLYLLFGVNPQGREIAVQLERLQEDWIKGEFDKATARWRLSLDGE